MWLTVVLDRPVSTDPWRLEDFEGEWPPEAHDALQRGIESVRERLDGVGIEVASLTVRVVPSAQEVDVRAMLVVAERKVVRNRADVDLARAIDQVLRELGRAVDDGAFDALPSGGGDAAIRVPWRMVSDSAHQYAQHCVTNAIRRGDLTAGRVDPADLAEVALSEQLSERRVRDLPGALRVLCARIEEQLAEEVAREADPDLQLASPEPQDGPSGAQDEPADTPEPEVADHVGALPDLDARIDHAHQRHRLTEALFALHGGDRHLIIETAGRGFPPEVAAGASDQPERAPVRRLRRIVAKLARRLAMTPAEVVDAYEALGQEVRYDRAGLSEQPSAFE